MTTSKYPDDFRDRFRRQEWNNLTEIQKEVMCRQYELYDALRRTGSEMHQPSFMLAHHNKMRHSPCSKCCGDERYIAHRATFFKELEDELEEQHERRLSQKAEEASPRKRRVKSHDSVSRDPTPRRSVSRTKVGEEHSSKCTKRKQRSSVRRRKEDSKPRERTSSKRRVRSEQSRKKNSVKKKSHSTNRTASDPCNTGSCNQRSKLRKKSSYKRSSEINNKPLIEERPTSCKNTFEIKECFYDEKTEDTGFRIPADSRDSQESSPSLVTSNPMPAYEPDGNRRVTFDELDDIFNVKHSREQQIESLFRLLNEKAKKNVIPHQHACPNGYQWTRDTKQEIPRTQIAFSLPTIQGKRIPRHKQEVRTCRDLRTKREIPSNRRLHAELPSCKRKSQPSVKTTREHHVRESYEVRKQQSYRKEPKVNLSPSRITNRKRREPSTTQRRESTSINRKTNDNFLLQPPKARQSKRGSMSTISEPKRVITSRNVQQNPERFNSKQDECVPEHSRRHPKKKRESSVSNNTMANTCLREPPEQGCFHWGRAEKTPVMWDVYTSKGSTTTSSSPRTIKKRLGRNEKSGYCRNGESLKYGRVGEKIPQASLKEVEPSNKRVQFDTHRMYSTGPSRSRNKPLIASHRLP